jgi:hypothetical protein
MPKLPRATAIGLALVVLCAPPARAQTPISEILVRLIQADVLLAPQPPGSPFISHAAHFIPGEQEKLAPYFFNQAILSQLTTFPLGSSSGGFSYNYSPELGTFARATSSFGPAFAERALTVGRHRLSFGANYQHSSYDTFEGKNLQNGDIKFYLTHAFVGGFFFEGDIIQTALNLQLTTNTTALFATYGVTNRLDVAVAVPIVSVDMHATIDATILRLATGDTGPTSQIHVFPNGTKSATFSDAASKTGIGDVLVRGKLRFLDTPGGGLAAGLDVRLPSGDQTNLLGTGATQAKVTLIGSGTYARLEPHFNVGYTATGKSSSAFFNLANEFDYTAGTEIISGPKLTVTADLIGRSLRNIGRLQEEPRTFNYMNVAGVPGSTTLQEFALQPGNLNLLVGSAGVKFNAWGNLLVSADLLFPLTQAGIRARVTPVVGFDYAF